MSHGTPTPVHGPFDSEDMGSNERRRNVKAGLSKRISQGSCKCALCEEHGQRGKPENPMWSGRPGEQGEVFLCQGPDEATMRADGRPWA